MNHKIIYLFLALAACMLHANEAYYYVETKECTIPIKKSMKKVDDYSYRSVLNDTKNIESKSVMVIEDTRKVKQASIQKLKTNLSKEIKRYEYVLHYYDKNFEEMEMPDSFKIKSFLLELGKTTLVGSVYDEEYLKYLIEYCHGHKK